MSNNESKEMMQKYVDAYNAILLLKRNDIIPSCEFDKLRFTLLADIIITFERQLKEQGNE